MEKNLFFDGVQRAIAFVMAICFLIGLIPYYFSEVYSTLITLVTIQIIISLIRLRLLNVFFEILLVVFIFFSLIPVVGYLFRFMGFLFSMLDMVGFNSNSMFKVIRMNGKNYSNNANKKKDSKGISKEKEKPEFKDAEFREK